MTDAPTPIVPQRPKTFTAAPVHLTVAEVQKLLDATSSPNEVTYSKNSIDIIWSDLSDAKTDSIDDLRGLTRIGEIYSIRRPVAYNDGSMVSIRITEGAIDCHVLVTEGKPEADNAVNRVALAFEEIDPPKRQKTDLGIYHVLATYIPIMILAMTIVFKVPDSWGDRTALSLVIGAVGGFLCATLWALFNRHRSKNAKPWLTRERYTPQTLSLWQKVIRISVIVGILGGLISVVEFIF